jgi:hypothetical protein
VKPGAPDLCSLCLRRLALKAGDVITDPALLAKGMRIGSTDTANAPLSLVLKRRDSRGWEGTTPELKNCLGTWPDCNVIADGVTFLGWADEAKPTSEETYTSYARAKKRCPVLLPSGHQCALNAGDGHCIHVSEFQQGAGVGFSYEPPQPTPPPRALPFKRHPECAIPQLHVDGVMCMGCEGTIAYDQRMRDDGIATRWPPKRPTRPEPHTLAPSGMCGPVLSKLR